MTDVFICYSRRDLDFVRNLAEALRERATDMFVDVGEWWHEDASREHTVSGEEVLALESSDGTSTLSPGAADLPAVGKTRFEAIRTVRAAERADEVHTALTSATAVLVVVSPDLAASTRCRHELERAVALRKRIVLVRAQDIPVENLPEELRQFELFPFDADDFDTGVRRLVGALEARSRRTSAWAALHRRRWSLLGVMALLCLGLG